MPERFQIQLPNITAVRQPIVDPFPGWPPIIYDPTPTQPGPTFPTDGTRGVRPQGGNGDASFDALLLNLRELLKQCAAREDYRGAVEVYGQLMLDKIQSDPGALDALRELMKRFGMDLDDLPASSDPEREPVSATAIAAWTLGGLAVVAVLGWLAED